MPLAGFRHSRPRAPTSLQPAACVSWRQHDHRPWLCLLLLLGPEAALAAADSMHACNGNWQASWQQQQATSCVCSSSSLGIIPAWEQQQQQQEHYHEHPNRSMPGPPPSHDTPPTPPLTPLEPSPSPSRPPLALSYFGLWHLLLQRLQLMDRRLPDNFLIVAAARGTADAAAEPGPRRRLRRRWMHRRRCTVADSRSGALMCPRNASAACRKPPHRKHTHDPSSPLLLPGQAAELTPMPLTVQVPVQPWQASPRPGFTLYGILELLQRWLRGGTWVYGKGSTRLSVPALQRWGLRSVAAGLLVRVELLWLLDKAYVAVTLLFMLPLLLGGGLQLAAALLQRLLRLRGPGAWRRQQQRVVQQEQQQEQQQHRQTRHFQGFHIPASS